MKKKRILVVNDELDMRTFLCTLLGTCDYEPIVAESGQEGIWKAREFNPELVILDAMMPNEGGIHLYRELKTDDDLKHIPVIMLSDIAKKTFFHSPDMLELALGQSVPEPEAYIEKPVESEDLLQVAENLLAPSK
jgi:CheY-like chemotaxis protein